MRKVCNPLIRLPQVTIIIFWFNSEAPLFHRIFPSPDRVTPFGYLRCSRPPSTVEGTFPHRMGILWTSFICIRVHVSQQSHMGRYLFEQVVVDRRAGNV